MEVWQNTICGRFFIHLSPRAAIFVVASLTNDGSVGGWGSTGLLSHREAGALQKPRWKSQNETEKSISCWTLVFAEGVASRD